VIRIANETDLAAILELADARRRQYEIYQPAFWAKAPDSREKQLPFLAAQLQRENVIALVHETNGQIDGFLIATLVMAPPVYTAGLTCSVDDYCVAAPELWPTVGAALLEASAEAARTRGAAQMVIVTANRDRPKRTMLAGQGYTIASEWWTLPFCTPPKAN